MRTLIDKFVPHPKYRPDIDGLRAIAVLSVVIFHAFPDTFKGGFIGVDIFFVISGFLISTIIFKNLENNSFSFIEFYMRRIKRIFPALILVLISTFIFGWYVLFADESRQLGKHIVGGVSFISNFVLWRESSYFDNAAATKPLLHLWSLAIEEQFYIFWPLVMALVWKLRWGFLRVTAVVAFLSFAVNLYLVSGDLTAAFYSPISRFWELMLGSVLAYIALHKPELNSKFINAQSTIGFVLIILGLVFINEAREFPGWWALLPTLGAFFIISAGPKAKLNHLLLSNKLMVWIGLISYPLYLWHWPLLTFARILQTDTLEIRVTIVIVSMALAWLTYQLIEKPIRFGSYNRIKVLVLIVLMAAVGLLGGYSFKQNGLNSVSSDSSGKGEYIKYFMDIPRGHVLKVFEKHFRHECNFFDRQKAATGVSSKTAGSSIDSSCYTPDNKHDKILFIWGNSYAQMLNFGLMNNLPSNWQILQVASGGCAADIYKNDDLTDTGYCTRSNRLALKTIKETRPDVVIIAQELRQNLDKWKSIAEELKKAGVKKIIFTGPAPQWTTDLPRIIVRQLWNDTPRRTYVGINQEAWETNNILKEHFVQAEGQIFVNLIDFFCNKEGCLTYLGDDKKFNLMSWDTGHLTPIASDYLAKNLLVDIITRP